MKSIEPVCGLPPGYNCLRQDSIEVGCGECPWFGLKKSMAIASGTTSAKDWVVAG